MNRERDLREPVTEVRPIKGSAFVRLVRLTPEQQAQIDPEPLLVNFLKKNRLQIGDIAEGKLQVSGISTYENSSKIVTGRSITAEEIDQVQKWVKENAPELQEDSLFHNNMQGLESLKHQIALSSKPLL